MGIGAVAATTGAQPCGSNCDTQPPDVSSGRTRATPGPTNSVLISFTTSTACSPGANLSSVGCPYSTRRPARSTTSRTETDFEGATAGPGIFDRDRDEINEKNCAMRVA